ncbi:SAGA-associated factor 73 [Choanephora cucurbitarum]|uniref:SAGA-associated factor 73 n=1 Tax=Choanephora cucurbitarum TaxID=101091 RepID=A0A1C7NMA6_9FUNG|nr:SAGA-associated factor 73 [Choanephora cucurbitarum]
MASNKKALSYDEQDMLSETFEEIDGKKRKRKEPADEEDSARNELEATEDKKKLKKDKKLKQKPTPKKKAPLDLDKQCGVLIPPNNNPCTRSLTCKIHSMGAKRSVEGRSQPFNDLLAVYQKKSIDKVQDKKGPISHNKNETLPAQPQEELMAEKEEEVDVDSDEETESVRLAIEQSRPLPLCRKQVFYVRRKRAYFRLRDVLFDTITPKHDSSNDLSQKAPLPSIPF